MQITDIARVAHEANRAYCIGQADFSKPAWVDAPEEQRHSVIDGVEFLIANPLADQRSSHDNWCATKYASGWTHGPVIDSEAKTHPCLVPFEMLTEEHRAKDSLFVGIVRALVHLL